MRAAKIAANKEEMNARGYTQFYGESCKKCGNNIRLIDGRCKQCRYAYENTRKRDTYVSATIYTSSVPCSKCGCLERYTTGNACHQCKQKANKKRYPENPARIILDAPERKKTCRKITIKTCDPVAIALASGLVKIKKYGLCQRQYVHFGLKL